MMRTLTFRLVLLTVASLPLETAYALPGSSSLSRIVGVLAAVSWALTVIIDRRVRAPHTFHIVALAFVLWNACSLLWTVDGPATQTRVLTYAQLLVLLFVVWEVVTTTSALRSVLVAFLVGCYVAAASMLLGYVLGAAAEWHGRVTIGGFNPNDEGLILALGFAVACYLLISRPSGSHERLVMGLAATYPPLMAFVVLGTGSRAAIVAVIPSLWYGGRLLHQRRPSAAFAAAIGLVGLVIAVFPLLPPDSVSRIDATGTDLLQGNLNERQDVWAEAVRLIAAHPFVGVGAGAFQTAAVGVNKVGHNLVLTLLAEVGVVGLALFGAMIVVAFRAVRTTPRELRGLWVTLVVAWSSAALLHNWEYRKLTWLVFGLMVACGALSDAAGERRTPATPIAGGRGVPPPLEFPGGGTAGRAVATEARESGETR